MSKGKQWWPLQATYTDVKDALTDFQDRLRQKQWLRKDNATHAYHVYLREGVNNLALPSTVNDYMQFSQTDPSSKNVLRAQVLRALCVLLKWQILLKSDAVVADVPQVFLVPSVDQTYHMHIGVVATLQSQNKSFTLIVSEQALSSQPKSFLGKTKHWVVAQTGDSYKWLTIKAWMDARKKPSFGKWVFASFAERKHWVETLQNPHDTVIKQEQGVFFVEAHGEQDVALLKQMNAMWHASFKLWALPEFVEEEALKLFMSQEKKEREKYHSPPSNKQGYNQHKTRYDEQLAQQLGEQHQVYVRQEGVDPASVR